ncbi:MAG: hypothetical protein JWN49_300 [Parcubacteria group bacterium]|nr:hypothetical protein [Parcubacteria group bacterium]
MNKKNKMIAGAAVVLVVVAGVAFYGGMAYAKGGSNAGTQARAGQFGGAQSATGAGRTGARNGVFGGVAGMGGATFGQVIAKDDKSITVKLATGGSKIVFITPTTPVSKDVSGSLADVAVGTQVTVAGSANADGSISAQSVRIGSPTMRGTASSTPARY